MQFRAACLPPYRPDPSPRILRGVEAFRFALQWSPNPSSSGTVYRTAAFHDVGAFNPRVPWGEDWEIWFRFAQRWDVAYMDAPSALYRIHAQATTAEFAREDRLCFAYDDIYTRAARLCPYPDLRPQLRRAFLRVARLLCRRGLPPGAPAQMGLVAVRRPRGAGVGHRCSGRMKLPLPDHLRLYRLRASEMSSGAGSERAVTEERAGLRSNRRKLSPYVIGDPVTREIAVLDPRPVRRSS